MDIKVIRTHSLSDAECQQISEELADKLITAYGGSKTVDGSDVHYKHPSGSKGTLSYSDSEFIVEVKLSFLMKAMSKMIEAEINRQCDKYLD